MRSLGRDSVRAWRRLRATPFFTVFAIGTLAVGIGATTAISSVVRAALAPPSGVRDIASLLNVYHFPQGSVPMRGFSWPDYVDLQNRQTSFEGVAAWAMLRQSIAANGQTETAYGEIVSGNYFHVLGVRAALGRVLQAADDSPLSPPVAVISYGLWQRLFAADSDVVGRTIRLNGRLFEIAGVAPRDFRGLFNGGLVPTAMWVPLAAAPQFPQLGVSDDARRRDNRWLSVKGRLRDGSTIDQTAAEVRAIAAQLDAEAPIGRDIADPRLRAPYRVERRWSLLPAAEVLINENASALVGSLAAAAMTAVALVLVVACANLASLMLARGSIRRQELAVRLALGASRWQLIREGLTETAILAAVGGLAGVGLGRLLLVWLHADLDVGRGAFLRVEPRIDDTVLAVSIGAALTALVVTGLAPALQSARTDVRAALAIESGTAAPRWRGRRLLIAAQVAVSVVFLAVMAHFVTQFQRESRVDTGLDLERLAVAEVDFTTQGIDETRARAIVTSVLGQLTHRAGVQAAAVSSGLPIGLTSPGAVVAGPDRTRQMAEFLAASPEIFTTLGVSIVRGRGFDERDVTGSDHVVVINEISARRLFDTEDVVGRRVTVERRRWVGEPPQPPHERTIIGVASTSDAGTAGRRDAGVVYVPYAQHYEGRVVFSARGTDDPAVLAGHLRAVLRAADPELVVGQLGTGRTVAAPPNLFAQVTAGVAGVLGGFALVLALTGLVGVLSHLVARRTREIGIRLALGASPGYIQRSVIREGLSPVVLGLLAGLAITVVVMILLHSTVLRSLFAPEPLAMSLVAVGFAAAGALACWIPARRASRVDPNVALREL